MTQPDLIFSNDINIVTQVDVQYASSGAATPEAIVYHYTHSPLPTVLLFAVILMSIFNRFILEFLIRWRRKPAKK